MRQGSLITLCPFALLPFTCSTSTGKNVEGAAKTLRIPALSPGWRGSFEKIVGRG